MSRSFLCLEVNVTDINYNKLAVMDYNYYAETETETL